MDEKNELSRRIDTTLEQVHRVAGALGYCPTCCIPATAKCWYCGEKVCGDCGLVLPDGVYCTVCYRLEVLDK